MCSLSSPQQTLGGHLQHRVNLGDSDPSASEAGDGEGGGTSQSQMNSRYAQLLPASLGGSGRCRLNGLFEVGCGMVSSMLMTGMAAYGSQPTYAVIYNRHGYVGFALFDMAAARAGVDFFRNGMVGYLPAGVGYSSDSATPFSGSGWTEQWQSYVEYAFADRWEEDRYNDASGDSFTVATNVGGFVQQNTGRVELTDRDMMWYKGRKGYAQELINTRTSCGEFLASNFIYDDVAHALEYQKPFDGLRSTISVRDAGLATPYSGSDKMLHDLNNAPVNEAMGRASAKTAIYTEATKYHVYFNPNRMNAIVLIHEALHSATRLNDFQLAKKLTGTDYEHFPSGKQDPDGAVKASRAITDILAKHGCGRR